MLEPSTYASVHSLFEEMTYHLAVSTVLSGILEGRIYVDDPANPRAAILIPSSRHRVYVGGEPEPRLLADVIHLLYKESLAESYGFVVYYDTSHTWKQTLEYVLQKQETGSGWRQFYRLREPSSKALSPLPEQITIGRIDGAMFADTTLVNRDLLLEEIHSESPSLEHFFRQHFGFCAQDGHQLVAWCLAEYHYQGRYELGIETTEAYQRKGIATHLASTVIRHAFTQGATEIGWHCWAANTPSVATALKVGFEKVLDYPVCYGQYRPVLT
ncbi:MAG: GNAT family N-acetyltransferase [Ktedonobacteraceae bacterium]|nr:GNAT family N-acetyltransferase [Ktedonobacteraceae bacterium]MBO0791277.1 GNAT family N-acetyltransferase [Ktedonobacteraceae bacterium]